MHAQRVELIKTVLVPVKNKDTQTHCTDSINPGIRVYTATGKKKAQMLPLSSINCYKMSLLCFTRIWVARRSNLERD